jgi:large subunit ribosomal protein L10
MAHVADWKFNEVEQLTNLLTQNKIIGIADIGGIPAPQLQKMRENLREKASIRAAKNSLIFRALEEADKNTEGIDGLKEGIKGQAAIIATEMNPFILFKEIKATRANAPAKGGEIAPHDIEVKAGDTPFKPGPVVGELQKAGIPAAIQEGKVVIKSDKVVVPAGEKIPADVAQMLTRLEIYPLEIGMKLNIVYQEGSIFKPEVLDIDMDQFLGQLHTASSNAVTLAVETAWTNTATIDLLIKKAYHNAHVLALEKNILTKETIQQFLTKAHTSMLSLASKAQDALDEELKKKLT